MKNKAFTLIELLAVIIILGVLMLIAIPSVTEYITNSRKNAYITTIKQYVSGATTKVNSMDIKATDPNTTYYVPLSCIPLETGGNSPFGDFVDAYIVVVFDGSTKYSYYFTGRDSGGYGVLLTLSDNLNDESIRTSITEIDTSIGIGSRENIIILNENTCKTEDGIVTTASSSIKDGSEYDGTTDSIITKRNKLIYYIKSDTSIPIDNKASTYVTSSSGINFGKAPSDTNGKGLYLRSGTEKSSNPIYYYRGEVSDNNVIFAGFCWKIVRTTETGGTKLIYNGLPSGGKCNNTGNATRIGSSRFNSDYKSPADVGYMYGTRYTPSSGSFSSLVGNIVFGNDVVYENGSYKLKDTYSLENGVDSSLEPIASKYHYTCFTESDTCESVNYIYYAYGGANISLNYFTLTAGKNINNILDEMYSNDTDSIIKITIDNWYRTNLLSYTSKIEDTIWCNDRSIAVMAGFDKNTSFLNDRLLYSGDKRADRSTPVITCPNKRDSFTVGSSGNGKLTYPIGMLTSDELILAGSGRVGYSASAYLNSGNTWYVITPKGFTKSRAGMLTLYRQYIFGADTNVTGSIRPSISLNKDATIISGTGTSDNPYIVQ